MEKRIRGGFAATLAAMMMLVPALCLGDGIVIKPHEDGWRPGLEQTQQAVITYSDGVQRLIVAVDIDEAEAQSMVWLLPVPAAAKDVRVDVLASFPFIGGTEVYGGAQENLNYMRMAAAAAQVWPAAIVAAGGLLISFFESRQERLPAAKAAAAPKGEALTVHSHVERAGMVVEVITAKEGSALYLYLAGKGLNLKPGAVPALDSYIGKDYSFVASWVTPQPETKDNGSFTRGIDLRFPTAEMYFPLLPTSAYGDRVVPASIRVSGHVTPRPFADIAPYTRIGYHIAHGRGEGPMARYTRIDIEAPAKAFTQDLWISPKAPDRPSLPFATAIASHPVITFFVLLLPLSAAIAVLAGAMLFRDLRSRAGAARLAVIGACNAFSLLGVLALLGRLPQGWGRRVGFLFLFSVLFMLIYALATWSIDIVFEPMKPNFHIGAGFKG